MNEFKNRLRNLHKKILFIFFVILFSVPMFCLSQSNSYSTEKINNRLSEVFEDSVSNWNNLIAKATLSNRYIYLYCHKIQYQAELERMFKPQKTFKLLDSNFISVNLYIDSKPYPFKTTKCSKGLVDSLINLYDIREYPANLFFDKTGKALDKNINSSNYDTNCLYNELQYFLSGKGHYYTMLERFKNGDRSSDLIISLYKMTRIGLHTEIDVAKEFISTLPKRKTFTKSNGEILLEIADARNDCFEHLFVNRKKWYKAVGKEKVDAKIYHELFFDVQVSSAFYCHHKAVKTCLEETRQNYLKQLEGYIEYDSLVHLFTIVDYSFEWKEWDNFLANVGNAIDVWSKFDMNDIWMYKYAKEIATRSYNKELLQRTINWVESVFKPSSNSDYLNVYKKLIEKLNSLK